MADRYERIRKALEMGPTPGPWVPKELPRDIQRDCYKFAISRSGHCWWIAKVAHDANGRPGAANATYITACDPDTIRELLAERDALAAAIEAAQAERDVMREALEDIRSRMRLNPFDRLAELDNIHKIADAALSAAERADGRTH